MNEKYDGVCLGDALINLKIKSKWRYYKGAAYSKMDSSLDKLCNELTAPVRKINKKNNKRNKRNMNDDKPMGETLVAFGAADVNSVGFGYAHAPQKRLRHRLQFIHNCKVTLIDEWRTSQILSKFDIDKENKKGSSSSSSSSNDMDTTHSQSPIFLKTPLRDLRKVTKEEYKSGKWKRMMCYQVYSVRYGLVNGRRVYVHRDVNAAKNIGAIYISLVEHRVRPHEFTPPWRQKEKQNAGSTTTPIANS